MAPNLEVAFTEAAGRQDKLNARIVNVTQLAAHEDSIQNQIEVRNEGEEVIFATACRSKISGKLFLHISDTPQTNSHPERQGAILGGDYGILEVKEVET